MLQIVLYWTFLRILITQAPRFVSIASGSLQKKDFFFFLKTARKPLMKPKQHLKNFKQKICLDAQMFIYDIRFFVWQFTAKNTGVIAESGKMNLNPDSLVELSFNTHRTGTCCESRILEEGGAGGIRVSRGFRKFFRKKIFLLLLVVVTL